MLDLWRPFSLSPVAKFGVLETSTDASQVFEKQKNEMGIKAQSLGLLLITTKYSL
jgi:hypothetical protein